MPGRLTVIITLSLVAALFLASCGPKQQPAGVTPTAKPPGQPEALKRGETLYQANCLTCHGARGEGDPNWRVQGPDGRYPAPPHDNSGHTWHHADGLLFRIIKGGGASLNIPGFQSGMPAFEDRLKDEEIKAVILYLKTLWGPQEREFQAEVSKQDPFP